MNRRDFIKVSAAGIGTLLVSGIGITALNNTQNAEPKTEAAPVQNSQQLKIVVITGSPHRNGTSALLADNFIQGAQSKGCSVFRFNAAFADINPCRGCNACNRNGPCVLNDDIEKDLITRLTQADLIALISPVYYFHVSAQLKTVIDRFYSRTGRISNKQSVLLAAAGSNTELTMRSLRKFYATLSNYMHWQDRGSVLAPGCPTREAILKTHYPHEAYTLGSSL